MTNPPPPAVHYARVELTPRGSVARCNCGWSGPPRRTITAAYIDLDAHEADHPIRSHLPEEAP